MMAEQGTSAMQFYDIDDEIEYQEKDVKPLKFAY